MSEDLRNLPGSLTELDQVSDQKTTKKDKNENVIYLIYHTDSPIHLMKFEVNFIDIPTLS